MSELALDHVQGNALVCHLDCVGVAQLVRGETAAHAGLGCDASQVFRAAAGDQGLPRV